jgi:hypothetical protein
MHPNTQENLQHSITTTVEQAPSEQSTTFQSEPEEGTLTQDVAAMSPATVAIDLAKQEALRAKFEDTINNPRFWAKDTRYDTLMSALAVPLFDDRSLHQFYIHAESDMTADAAKKSSAAGVPAVLPTEEEIIAEAWRRWLADETKEVTKSLNKQRREEAKKAGTKFIPVSAEEVHAIVAKAEAELRASENSYAVEPTGDN